jgi:hypothetical protein
MIYKRRTSFAGLRRHENKYFKMEIIGNHLFADIPHDKIQFFR